MPENSFITINNGGRLIVNNTIIKNDFNSEWNGITVKSGGLLIINASVISDYYITVESGGSIIIKGSLSMSGNHNITVQSGGYYCFDSNPSIHLADYNCLIKLNSGAINGINPVLSGITVNCSILPVASGFGNIIDFNQDVYIQNETISTNRYIGGKNIYVGNNVTNSKQAGDVVINNGSLVIFDCENITFDSGFECTNGSQFETIIRE